MGLRLVPILAFISAVMLQHAHGMSESFIMKMKNDSMTNFVECMDEMGITKEMLHEDKQNKTMEDHACLLACFFKKSGVLDDTGMYMLENALKISKEIGKGETEKDLKELEDIILKCASVNDEPVKDGKKGCERSFLLYKCFLS